MAFGASPPRVTMPCTRTDERQLLAQQADRDLCDGEGVGGVDAPFRVGRGVCGLALVFDVAVRHGKWSRPRNVDGSGVDHRGSVLPVESVAFEQFDLAAAAFFGRRADHRQGQAEVVDDGRQCERRPDGDRGDQVVAARMSEAGKRVVLGAQRDVQIAAADASGERGVEAAVAAR